VFPGSEIVEKKKLKRDIPYKERAIMRSSATFLLINTITNINNLAFGFTVALRNVNFIKNSNTKLYNIIRGDKDAELVDDRRGGVGLAMDNAIKISGTAKYSSKSKGDEPSINITPAALLRYKKLTNVNSIDTKNVVCYGVGKELYKEPTKENPYEKEIYYAPAEAAKDAITKVSASALDDDANDSLIINILGGEELMLNEALDAVFTIVNKLFVENGQGASIQNISFNSLCDSSIPSDTATVSVFTASKGDEDAKELYFYNDNWLTVLKEDLNTARN